MIPTSNKCPCEECICLAICLCKVEKYGIVWMITSLAKHCEILNDYLFIGADMHARLKHARKFYADRKDKI